MDERIQAPAVLREDLAAHVAGERLGDHIGEARIHTPLELGCSRYC